MKSLYKNHSVYFFKNKILMSLVTILFLSSFAVAPFFLNQSLLYNYNWLTYFIVYTIVILLSLTLCHFFLISSKKNQYDQILNSLYSNSRKIFISKYLFLLTANYRMILQKLILPSTEKIFYLNNGHKYLLDLKYFNLWNVKINNEKYHFESSQAITKFIINYVNLNAKPIIGGVK